MKKAEHILNKTTIKRKAVSNEMANFLANELKKFYIKRDVSEKLLIKKTIQFIKMGANLKYSTPHFSFLENAVSNDYNTLAKLLIENDVILSPSSHTGITPLYFACIKGNYEIVRILCELGVAKNYMQHTTHPIIINMLKSEKYIQNQTLIIECLLSNGYNAKSEKTIGNETPLFFAAHIADEKIVTLLLEHGINPLIKNYKFEKTAYDVAITKSLNIANLIEKYEHIWEDKLKKEQEQEARYNNMFEEVLEEMKAKVQQKNEDKIEKESTKIIPEK